jgi:hypothetical protein
LQQHYSQSASPHSNLSSFTLHGKQESQSPNAVISYANDDGDQDDDPEDDRDDDEGGSSFADNPDSDDESNGSSKRRGTKLTTPKKNGATKEETDEAKKKAKEAVDVQNFIRALQQPSRIIPGQNVSTTMVYRLCRMGMGQSNMGMIVGQSGNIRTEFHLIKEELRKEASKAASKLVPGYDPSATIPKTAIEMHRYVAELYWAIKNVANISDKVGKNGRDAQAVERIRKDYYGKTPEQVLMCCYQVYVSNFPAIPWSF